MSPALGQLVKLSGVSQNCKEVGITVLREQLLYFPENIEAYLGIE